MPRAVNVFALENGALVTVRWTATDRPLLPSVSITVDTKAIEALCLETVREMTRALVLEYIPENERRNSRRNRIKRVLDPARMLGVSTVDILH